MSEAEQLSGRALDEACARAMGERRLWVKHGGGANDVELPPRQWSTDPATLDEKLAWLRAHQDFRSLSLSTWDSPPGRPEWIWTATFYYPAGDRRLNTTKHGKDIHEATARLVCAVAAARREDGHG